MALAVKFVNSKRTFVEATSDDVPPDHPIALAVARENMVVSAFQARAALAAANPPLLAQAEAAVIAEGGAAQLAWDHAVEFRRNSPTILALAPILGLTDEQLDSLFEVAAGIEA